MKQNSIVLKCFLLFITITSCSKSELYPFPTARYNTRISNPLPPSVGPAGNNDNLVYYASGNPDLALGVLGDYYLDISQGLLYGPKTRMDWGNIRKFDGTPSAYVKIYSGDGAPDNATGTLGDYYLDVRNFLFYGPKGATEWGSPIQL